MAAIASNTERIRIGPMVTPLPRRHPLKLAREAVTRDRLSAGRLTLGLGSGGGPWEWECLGNEADPRVRADMLDEGLELLTAIWSEEPVSHRGAHYTVDVTGLPGYVGNAYFSPGPAKTNPAANMPSTPHAAQRTTSFHANRRVPKTGASTSPIPQVMPKAP